MILFCDTSALIKLYLREPDSDRMLGLAQRATALAVCRIAWAEAMAALARRSREVPEDAPTIDHAKARLQAHWHSYLIVEVTQPLVELAGDYADTFALRGYDSVQLAAARTLGAPAGAEVNFACFDSRLNKAAKVLGLKNLDLQDKRIDS